MWHIFRVGKFSIQFEEDTIFLQELSLEIYKVIGILFCRDSEIYFFNGRLMRNKLMLELILKPNLVLQVGLQLG